MALANLFRKDEARDASMSWSDYQRLFEQFAFNGQRYITPSGSFAELTALQGARNPIVAAAIDARMKVFSEVRFSWQPFSGGRPGRLFGNEQLTILEQPWPGGSTGALLSQMLVDADLYGNSYWVRRRQSGQPDQLVRLHPSNVVVVTGSVDDQETGQRYGSQLVGYAVVDQHRKEMAFFNPDEVAHFAPIPDDTGFTGKTWLNSVLPDVTADDEFTNYKHAFMRNAATPNLVVSFDPTITKEAFETFVNRLDAGHKGADKAFKTLYLGGGADVKVVGANFDQLNLKAVQGAGETRIASAAGVPASYLGISESLGGSALNAGNYTAARRRFADGTIRPLWRSAAAALQSLLEVPDSATRLWFDDRDVAFLQEDVKDAADIKNREALTVEALIRAGFFPDSAVEAVITGDLTVLVHTGLYSVQLQPSGAAAPPDIA
jgi:HK97 family phage portal protein